MKPLKQILTEGRSLITERKNWCQGVLARDAHGVATFVRSDAAKTFCGIGAVCRVADKDDGDRRAASYALDDGCYVLFGFPMPLVNDGVDGSDPETCHARVLQAYDYAIEHAEV